MICRALCPSEIPEYKEEIQQEKNERVMGLMNVAHLDDVETVTV